MVVVSSLRIVNPRASAKGAPPSPNQRERNVNNGNLKPFRPGQSGNPAGRPKGSSLRSAIRTALADRGTMESLVTTLIIRAKQGNMSAFRILVANTEAEEENDDEEEPEDSKVIRVFPPDYRFM